MNVAAIPQELRDRVQWVVWKAVWNEAKDKLDKQPFRALDTPRKASSTNPRTWATFEQAVAALDHPDVDGIGYVFAADDPYTGIDLDSGLSEADRMAVVAALDSYAETSPSGNGVHVIVRASLNGHGRNRKGPFEVYDHGRYFTVTGEHIRGTPATIEERQAQLEEVLARFLPKPEPKLTMPSEGSPVDLDDRELLDRAMAASNGTKFRDLWEGRWEHRYSSQSEADQALCSHLHFWTGDDPDRIDRLFRQSGLYRDKWKRADDRQKTIENVLGGVVYTPSEGPHREVRPPRDAVGTHPGNRPAADVESAGASLRPDVVGTQDGTHPLQPPSVEVEEPSLVVVGAAAFAAVEEASAEPLLGDEDGTVLAAGGSATWYGDGGAGKTMLGLDQAVHLCAGRDWLGLDVKRRCRVLWIENEGPRGKFREKLRRKLAAWDGPKVDGWLFVLERPWSLFTFQKPQHRAELVAVIREHEIDVVFAGPVQRLGVEGGGTPAEIQAFVDLLEQVRFDLDRPLAFELIHHENKAGAVSGAWEGATDTLAHVQARGNGHTAIVWDKARWASELHGRTWKLNWRDGEAFEVDDTPETTDEAIADQLLGLVRESPGKSWNAYDVLLQGRGTRKRVVRDQLLEDGRLVNLGTDKAMKLYLREQADTPAQTAIEEDA